MNDCRGGGPPPPPGLCMVLQLQSRKVQRSKAKAVVVGWRASVRRRRVSVVSSTPQKSSLGSRQNRRSSLEAAAGDSLAAPGRESCYDLLPCNSDSPRKSP